MNKIMYFLILVLAAVGIIGGIGYTIYDKVYVISTGLVVAAIMAWPKFYDYYKKLLD